MFVQESLAAFAAEMKFEIVGEAAIAETTIAHGQAGKLWATQAAVSCPGGFEQACSYWSPRICNAVKLTLARSGERVKAIRGQACLEVM